MSSYTGGRIVPKHCGVWSSANEYEMLSIVLYGATGDSYMARKAVPKGVAITDTEYWAFCADYSAQLSMIASDVDSLETDLKTLREQVAANVTASTDADADYAAEVVDARADPEGETYDSLGENIRSATSGLIPKITPAGVGKVAASGNSVTIARNGKIVEGQFTHSGSSYIGLFANFFGKYEDVEGKKITVVMQSDTVITMSVLLTNSGSAWGGGTVKSLTLESAKFTEDNGRTVRMTVDFTSDEVVEWASDVTQNIYFVLRYQGSTAVESCSIRMYAYDSTEIPGFYWKYAAFSDTARFSDEAAIAEEADHAAEADYAEEAGSAGSAAGADYADEAGSADSAEYAKDAGYSKRNVYGTSKAGDSAISSLTKDGNAVTVVYSPVSTDSPNKTTYLWIYWLATYSIIDLFGKGVKFVISGTNTGGAYGPSFYKITTSSSSWASALKTVSVKKTTDEKFSFEVDIDSLDINPSEYSALYLLIGYDGRVSSADEDGNYVSGYEGQVDFKAVYTDDDHTVIATQLIGFDQDDYYKADEVDGKIEEVEANIEEVAEKVGDITSIVCWGDSLTAGGGWTTRLQTLSGLTVYNGGTGGENARTIMARQGGDVMLVNNITIPAECEAVTIAERETDSGITTQLGNVVTPLLQGGSHVNPVMIGDIKGTLKWTGSNYADTTGTWTFTRSEAGEAVEITRPTAIRTNYDRIHNGKDTIMIIFMGQNGGYSSIDDLINMHRLMIDHFKGREYLILGLSSGTASSRASYEEAMQEAFGRRFISLREYLSTALYDEEGNIISCYGLDDQDLEMEETHTYGSATYVTADEIAAGTVPHQLLSDSVHYTSGTKTVIGNLIYKRLVELGILEQG